MSRNQKVLVLVAVVLIAILLISWGTKHLGMVGVGIGGFIFGYFAGRKNS